MQGQKLSENPFSQIFSPIKLREFEWILENLSLYQQSFLVRSYGFLQNSTGRIQMDSHTWLQISDPIHVIV